MKKKRKKDGEDDSFRAMCDPSLFLKLRKSLALACIGLFGLLVGYSLVYNSVRSGDLPLEMLLVSA